MSSILFYQSVNREKKRESQRSLIVFAVYFIYFLSLVEGPLRKWYLPSFAAPLTLLRDPFILALYVYCFLNGWIPRKGIGAVWLSFAAFTIGFSMVQFIFNDLPVTGWILGVRTYWLYMPLSFVIAKTFRKRDVTNFVKINLWIALPYSMLVIVQATSPPTAFINRTVGGEETGIFLIGPGLVRPYGLFSFTAGNVNFTASMVAMLISNFLSRNEERLPILYLIPISLAVIVMSVLTGSRSIYFYLASICGYTIISLLVANGITIKNLLRIIGIILLVLTGIVVFSGVFPDIFNAMMDRFDEASKIEGSIWNRAFMDILSPLDVVWTAPYFGYGMGLGAPGVASRLGLPDLIYGESDLQRNINELGVIAGTFFILLRLITAYILSVVTIKLAKSGSLLYSPFLGCVFLNLTVGQITHTHSVSFPSWMLIGFILSATEDKSFEAK